MSVRESFVQHFGEDNAVRVEEASIGHQNQDPTNHGQDNWGKDPFQYHLMNCIARQCFTRWDHYHGIDVAGDEVKQWVLAHGDLHAFDGDPPDYIGLYAGVYGSWINWEKAGQEMPEEWADFEEDLAHWEGMTQEQRVAEMKQLAQRAMELLNIHEKGPSDE